MKKNIFLLSVAVILSSCCVDRNYPYGWNDFDYKKQNYESYTSDVMTSCVVKPLLTLDYVQRVYETVGADKISAGSYFVTDTCKYMVGPLECRIEGRDTTWSFDSGMYTIKRQDADTWNVKMDGNGDGGKFRYEFELTATQAYEVAPGTVRKPWKVELRGDRLEDSAYHLLYDAEDLMSVCDRPGSFMSHDLDVTGTLSLRFMRGNNELDWLTAVYKENSVFYDKSF